MSEAHAAWASPVRARGLIPRRVDSPSLAVPKRSGRSMGFWTHRFRHRAEAWRRNKLMARSKLAPSPPRA